MKRIAKIAYTIFIFSLISFSAAAEEIELSLCTDKKLDVKFLCNLDWEMETNEGAVLIIISEDPAVTMTISKSNKSVLFLEQLNDRTLEAIGNYKEGFKAQKAWIKEKQGMKVEGFSRGYEEIRLLDYYFISGNTLYGILFSVNPKEGWEAYEPLFEKIVESVDFVKPDPAQAAAKIGY